MKKKKFSPETDFEKQNLDIIGKLQKIKDTELPDDFNKKLYKKLLSKKELNAEDGMFKKIFRFLQPLLDLHRPAVSIVFACLLAGMFFIGYQLLRTENLQLNNSGKIAGTAKNSTQEMITKYSAIKKNAAESPPELKSDKYLNDFHQKVLMNISYGFLHSPSIIEIKKILSSEKFKKKASEYTHPTQSDSIKILISILEEQ